MDPTILEGTSELKCLLGPTLENRGPRLGLDWMRWEGGVKVPDLRRAVGCGLRDTELRLPFVA